VLVYGLKDKQVKGIITAKGKMKNESDVREKTLLEWRR